MLKHLLTFVVCALLTVSLIVLVEAITIEEPEFTALVLFSVMTLPIVLLVATIWSVVGLTKGFTKIVKQWVANNQVDDCPHHLDTRTAYDRDKAIKDYRTALMYAAGEGVARDFAYGSPYGVAREDVVANWWDARTRKDAIASRDIVCFSDEAHVELANMLAKADWRVARGPDLKKRLPKGALRPGGDCWNDIAEALQTFQSNRWITASDIAAAAGDGSYSNAQVTTVLGRMAEFNIVTTSGSRRSKKYCVTDQWLRDVR